MSWTYSCKELSTYLYIILMEVVVYKKEMWMKIYVDIDIVSGLEKKW